MHLQKTLYASLFFIFILFLNNTLLAQKDYQPAYIISLQGDSIQGLLDYRNWSVNPQKINFKTSENGRIKTYTPIELKAFGVASDHYVSAIVERETSTTSINRLRYSSEFNLLLDTCFLQVIYHGKKSLYLHKSDTGKENAYINNNGNIELLKHKKYLDKNDNIKENKTYLSQLVSYLNDCENITPLASKTAYNIKALKKLFDSYYTCSEQTFSYTKKKEPIQLKFGLLAGVRHSKQEFASPNPALYFHKILYLDGERSTSPTAGVSLELILPRFQRRLSIYNEMIYSYYSFSNENYIYQTEDTHGKLELNLHLDYLKFNTMLRYGHFINIDKGTKVFANIGISNGFIINEKTNSAVVEVRNFDNVVRTESTLIKDPKSYEQALLAGLGINFKHLGFELRYSQGNSISPFIRLESITKTFNFLFSYRF